MNQECPGETWTYGQPSEVLEALNHFVDSLTKNDSVQRGLCVEGPRPSRGGEGVTQGPFLRFLFTAQRAFQTWRL